ncbi:MAG: PAS domain S-box protein [Aquabacterium sp.]|uniref:PAS domain S-box protein n=1 Tax=Aquabacterium sp. TaxID=1872578 RepID=UPI00271A5E92|nr:PAS domain S-box protein [Aquabacterium sp.]MDO9003378.1 PAS domain S-box protein [Aquabacterium sp.]
MNHHLPAGLDQVSVFQSIFKAYPDALLLVDGGGTIVMANPAATELLGYGMGELVGLAVDALVPDAIRPRHAHYREEYSHKPHARPMGTQMDLVAKRKDGSEVMVEIALSPLKDFGFPYVVTAIRGIGAYPRVKQALQRARYSDYVARLGRLAVDMRDPQELMQQVPVMATDALQVESSAVYLLDDSRLHFQVASGVGLVAEEPLRTLIPCTPDRIPGHVLATNAPLLVPDGRIETRVTVLPAYLEAGLISGLAVPLSDRGRTVGVLVVRSTQAARFGEDETRFLESVGNLLASTLQRAQTEEALRHSQRLESVGQLTGGIAHDFNNLLTVIQGNLQVLEELPAITGDPHAQQLLGAALRAGKRSAELTSKLLAFSRRQVLQPGRVDVVAQLYSLADMLRRTLDQRIQIRLEVDESCPPCLADPGQLEAALLNLAINARDAMPDGGTLTIACKACDTLPDDIQSEVVDADGQATTHPFVEISLTDTGTGMSEEVKKRAFEPFFTTKEAGRGTGLGLSTVYGFARQSRGAVAMDSTIGVGTTLTLYIPATPQKDEPELSPATSKHLVPVNLRVVLVEDDAEVRAVVQRFLETLGCRVTPFASAEEALIGFDAGEDAQLLLTDIALGPGMRGMELAKIAQARWPALAIILMSGFSSELLDANRDAPEHWELLQKPYGRDELANAIARVTSASPH